MQAGLLRVHLSQQLAELRLHLRSSAAVVRLPMVRRAKSDDVPNPIRPLFSERLYVVGLDVQPPIVHTEPLRIAQLATPIGASQHRAPNGWISSNALRERSNLFRAVRAKQVMLVSKALRGTLCDRCGGTAALGGNRCLALQSAIARHLAVRRYGPRHRVKEAHSHEGAVLAQRGLITHVAFVDDDSHVAA